MSAYLITSILIGAAALAVMCYGLGFLDGRDSVRGRR